MTKLIPLVFCVLVSVPSAWAQRRSLAERLGHPAGARLLILHGDDLGMCRAANAAGIELFARGWLNSGSAMVPCPWFPELARWAKAHPKHDLGLHLTLTSEWKDYRWGPVSGRGAVPSLVGPEGFLWASSEEVAARAKLAEVERELRAQIARARQLGLEPTHLDSHMGALFGSPGLFASYLKVARQARLVPLVPRPTARQRAMLEKRGQLALAELMLRTTEAMGVPIIDSLLDPEGRDLAARKRWLLAALARLPAGVHQLILHPARASDELRHITHSHATREADYQLMLDADVKRAMTEAGIVPVTWAQLLVVYRRAISAR